VAFWRAQGTHFLKIQEGENESEKHALPVNNKRKVEGYLLALTIASLKVRCRVESSL
jgi:hypothetical protein